MPSGGDEACGKDHGQLTHADPGIPSPGVELERPGGDHVNANTGVERLAGMRCARCQGGRTCDAVEPEPAQALRGPRFVLSAIACFLIPLLFALGGALQFRSTHAAQLGGAWVGLSLGMLAWWGISSFLHDPERGK
jgi:hypothetical protein